MNKNCPFCGTEVIDDELDFVYPTDQSMLIWQAVCSNAACGCTVYGNNKQEALKNWNTRIIFTCADHT